MSAKVETKAAAMEPKVKKVTIEKDVKVVPEQAKSATTKVAVKKHGKPRNFRMSCGIMRFSRSKMYHKKALYKFVGKKTPPKEKVIKPSFVIKPIGGEKNGKERKVYCKKRPSCYPTAKRIKTRKPKKRFEKHKHRIRSTLKPGAVCILLAGVHKGKRVVLLKVLPSGLLLITGPFTVNGCPLRRISQRYVIGTRTRIDIKSVKVPAHVQHDEYFIREKKKRAKKSTEGDIFQAKKDKYKPNEQRKTDQVTVDKQVLTAIKLHPKSKLLLPYLKNRFGLRSSQYPHRMKF